MISFSIIRPAPKPAIRHVREILRAAQPKGAGTPIKQAVLDMSKVESALEVKKPLTESPPWEPIGAGKHQFNKWMNEVVYSKFKKGDLVTLTQVAHILNQEPMQWYRITDFQEVHFMAEYDNSRKENRVVGITSCHTEGNFPVFYAPSALRHLWPDEITAININDLEKKNAKLRNQSKNDTERSEDVSSDTRTDAYFGEGRTEEGDI